MVLQDNLAACACPGANIDINKQTLFLGVSIQSASLVGGWNGTATQLSVTLYEDYCPSDKCCYGSQCLEEKTVNAADPGFFGDPRWERDQDYVVDGVVRFPAGTQYSSCTPENLADTLVRPAVNLEGLPAYFRVGNFEWCGIITDWVKDISCDGIRYRVNLTDPKIILEQTQLIISEYQGSLFCEGACPNSNIFNVYGFAEQFGMPCTPYAQQAFDCSMPNQWGFYNSVANLGANVSVDGLIYGTPSGGFGGSCLNQDGMPFSSILSSLNVLANSIPSVVGTANQPFSPYGRVTFCKASYFTDNPNNTNLVYGLPPGTDPDDWCGLMVQENSVDACFNRLDFYLLDLSELTQVFTFDCGAGTTTLDKTYRLAGTSLTVMEMLEQLSTDFGFDYYVDLVPVRTDLGGGGTCDVITKIIKLRVINKKTQGTGANQICTFLDQPGCNVAVSQGRELITDAQSRFVLGAPKQTVYQVRQDGNPDAAFGGGNADNVLVSYDPVLGANRAIAGCDEIDDYIVPYMGLDQNGDLLNTCIVNEEYCWDLPTAGISNSLQHINFSGPYITVCQSEFLRALVDYDTWLGFALEGAGTPLGQRIKALGGALASLTGIRIEPGFDSPVPRDSANPDIDKFTTLTDTVWNDIATIYNWIREYADTYLGRQWAVRVPFTCCFPDVENQTVRFSEEPTNDGGWTEVCQVLGLPNTNYAVGRNRELLDFFRDETGKILPFVCFSDGAVKDTSSLPKDSFFIHWVASGDIFDGATKDNGTPTGTSGAGDYYIDLNTGMIYAANPPLWVPINQIGIFISDEDPANGVEVNDGLPADTPFLWVNINTNFIYIVNDVTVSGAGVITNIDFDGTLTMDLYVKAELETSYVFHDVSNCYAPRVVVKTPAGVFRRNDDRIFASGGLIIDPGEVKNSSLANVGGEDAIWAEQPPPCNIDAAAITLKHNEINYGPWCNPGDPSWGGDFLVDEQFAPWNFGGYAAMNNAGIFYACAGRRDDKSQEIGNITVPGYPTLPLGAELGAVTGTGGQYLVDTRTNSTGNENYTDVDGNPIVFNYSFVDYGNIWSGQFGPNITSININVDSSCNVTTQYSFRSYSPRATGNDRRVINQLQKANKRNLELTKRLRKLENLVASLRTFRN